MEVKHSFFISVHIFSDQPVQIGVVINVCCAFVTISHDLHMAYEPLQRVFFPRQMSFYVHPRILKG